MTVLPETRPGVARQIALVSCASVAVAVVLSGVVALGLVRSAYDGQARQVLHRDALLVAELADHTGGLVAARPGRPAGRLLVGSGIALLRVLPDGVSSGNAKVDAADIASAQQGQPVEATRTIAGRRAFVDVERVNSGGGVVLTERVSAARSVGQGVVRKLVIALLAGLLVAGGLAVLLARRISRPLVHAAGAARALAAGHRDLRMEPEGPREVADVATGLNSLAAALTISEGRQRDFLMSVSHELRTPLTAVRGFAEALADGVTTGDEVRSVGATIGAEAARLQRLVSDLLDLARIGADTFRLDLAALDLAELVRAAGQVWSARAADVGVPFSLDLPDGPVPVVSDATRVRQILDGLAENALRVTPSGRPIVFALTLAPPVAGAPAGTAVLAVRDGGPGLTDDDIAVAFDRSALYDRYRGVRTVGTGLGLALVHGLTTRLGGQAVAGHDPGGGAVFSIRLPLSPGPLP